MLIPLYKFIHLRFYSISKLFGKKRCVCCCIIGLNHVNCESIILAGVSKTVCDIGLCLSISTDVIYFQVQQIIILLQQRLIGRAQEVIRCVVDVQPYFFGRALAFIQLVGNLVINSCGICEIAVVLSCYSNI